MDKRNDTRQEVLLDIRNELITSIDELVEQCHRALSAQLWTTCCWSEGGLGWKIGDFNYLVVSVEPDADTSLYVQFWSEPRERVLTEIGSGESCPGAIRYIGSAQRNALEARGYARGGRAGNYEKELLIDSAAAAEAAALEVLQIFFEVFGYRGQWRRKFLAVMDWRVAKQNLYSLVALQADLTLTQPVSDEAISRVNSRFKFVKVWRTDTRTVRMRMPLVLDGGVTAAWLAQSLHHWMSSWSECERQLRRAAVPTKQRGTSQQHVELIH